MSREKYRAKLGLLNGGEPKKKMAEKASVEYHHRYQLTGLDLLALAHASLGTFNIGGDVETKLEAMIRRASELHMGVIGVQETATLGLQKRICADAGGDIWTLYTGGPSSPPTRHGTGFLLGPLFEALDFKVVSERVSWIKVRLHPTGYTDVHVEGVACFVNGYAPPLEAGARAEGATEQFYTDLSQALADARQASGVQDVTLVGDFNLHIGADLGESGLLYVTVLGPDLPEGPSSGNCARFLSFCDAEGLVVVQTFFHANTGKNPARWATWGHHPGSTVKPQLRDLILVPRGDKKKVRNCRPASNSMVDSDHQLVQCMVHSRRQHILSLQRKLARSHVEQPLQGKALSLGDTVPTVELDCSKVPDDAVHGFRSDPEARPSFEPGIICASGWCPLTTKLLHFTLITNI